MKSLLMLVFDVIGFMAHFRRFYSTATSLSYYFPPRNTIAGLLAAILGRERDSYYDLFSSENCGLAVSILTPLRKLTLPINYLDTDQVTLSRLRGIGGRVPTTIEFVLPEPPHTSLRYRIYVTCQNSEIFNELVRRVKTKTPVYPLSLGPAYCLAELLYVFDGKATIQHSNGDEFLISTVIREDLIAPNGLIPRENIKIIIEERLPPNFTHNREPTGRSFNYIFEANGRQIPVRIKGDVFSIVLSGEVVYGVFM
ncbi:MAG: CRISPR-associated protein Cas5 [Nitrososphaerota archaeon]|nr:CRISPR-associated protein Cas5 [Thermoproteota archaeon]